MILINLLPHREEKRARRKQAFFAGLVFAAATGAVIAALWYLVLQQMIATQQERNSYLTAEIGKLEEQIKDIATLRAEIDALKARQNAVEDLQTDRNIPVNLLNELAKQTPEGVYLVAIKQNNMSVAITGVAQTNERVSEFLRNTAYNSSWLEKPELVEIKAATMSASSKEQRRLFDFSVRVNLKRSPVMGSSEAPAGAASSPKPIRSKS